MGHRRAVLNAELCVFALVLDLQAASESEAVPFVPPTHSELFAHIFRSRQVAALSTGALQRRK